MTSTNTTNEYNIAIATSMAMKSGVPCYIHKHCRNVIFLGVPHNFEGCKTTMSSDEGHNNHNKKIEIQFMNYGKIELTKYKVNDIELRFCYTNFVFNP